MSNSIIVNWLDKSHVEITDFKSDEETVVYKQTAITDGNHIGDEVNLKMYVYYDGNNSEKKPCVLLYQSEDFSPAIPKVLKQNSNTSERRDMLLRLLNIIGQGLYNDAVCDINDAIRYLKANTDKYNIDADNIVLMGNSAGGYLVSMTSASQGTEEFAGENNLEYPTDVKGVIDLYGLSDISKVADDYDEESKKNSNGTVSPANQFINGVLSGKELQDDHETIRKSNVMTYVDGNEPEFLLMQSDDVTVSPSQTVLLHNAFLEMGVEATRYSLTNAGHVSGGFDSEEAFTVMTDFIKKVTAS